MAKQVRARGLVQRGGRSTAARTATMAATVVLFTTALGACGGGDPGPQPVTGSWTTSERATESTTVSTYTFAAGGTWTSVEITTYDPTAVLANCQLEIDTTGGTYDLSARDGAQRLGLTGTTTAAETRTHCDNTLLDTPTTRFTRTRDVAGTYTLEGNTLTVMWEGNDGRPGETQVFTREP